MKEIKYIILYLINYGSGSGSTTLDAPIYIGAVTAERDIFLSPLCLFVKTSPLN
jgi:hypothetical protein